MRPAGCVVAWCCVVVVACAEGAERPSQTEGDARRDGVVAAVAELPISVRVERVVEVSAEEGLWVLSRLTDVAMDSASGGVFGEIDGEYLEEFVYAYGYGEVLLVSEGGGIIRAYPMPATNPDWILLTPAAVYAGHIGDGAPADSTLVRINRTSLEAEVVLIPAPLDSGQLWPRSWHIALAEQALRFPEVVRYGSGAAGTEAVSRYGP